MRPIDGDEAIRAIPKWKRYGVDEEGKLSEWKTGSPAYVNLEDVLDTVARMPTIDISTGWIPVTERLPEKTGSYFLTFADGALAIEKYCASNLDGVLNKGLSPVDGIDIFPGDTNSGWIYYSYESQKWKKEITLPIAWMPLPEPYRKD